MTYPRASEEQIAFFREHGWLVVEDAIALGELAEIGRRLEVILEKKERLAFATHLRAAGRATTTPGKVYVNQATGERTKPPTR